ncbi:MAG TPA: hypothetical protein PKM50_09780, partial [Methanoregula sp.]|nr:hypothetical protein [Methanoregula sp.]
GKSQNIPDAKTTGSQKTYSWNGIKGIQRWAPSIYGDRVVWFQGYPAGTYSNADIAFLNTTTNEMTLLNESSSAKGGLKIYGDNVAWYAYYENVTDASTNSRIFLHNLVTGKDTVISPGPGLKRYTSLSDKYIGWTDFGNPLATPIPPGQVHIYTLSSGTTQTIPGTTMNQFLDFIYGDYAVYSECTPYEIVKKTNKVSCDSKIYDIKTGNIWQLPSSKDSRTAGSSSEYDRKIVGYSDGLILVEDARGDEPVLSLFRAEDLRPAETITAVTPEPALPEKNVTSQQGATTPVLPSQASPGFGFVGMIAALVILCGIAGKSARPPRGRS